ADRIERTGARQTQGLQGRVEARERNRAAARTRAPTVTGSRGLQTEPRNQWGGRGAKERRRFSAAAKNPKAISRAPRSIGASQATGSVVTSMPSALEGMDRQLGPAAERPDTFQHPVKLSPAPRKRRNGTRPQEPTQRQVAQLVGGEQSPERRVLFA